MGRCDQLRTLCCTVEGLRKLKKAFTMIVGTAFITVAVLSLVNILGNVFNFVNFVRMVWNIIFGVLMLMLQFGKTEWLIHRFGFMGHWVGRALFFLFCGTNILVVDPDNAACFFCFISWVIGGMCMFVGILEIVFGCRCEGENLSRNTSSQQGGQYAGQNAAMPPADQQQQQPPAAKKKSGFSSVFSSGGSGGGSGGSGGSGAAINPALERARSANAERTATGGGASSEPSFQVTVGAPAASGGSDNPFFGNAHLST